MSVGLPALMLAGGAFQAVSQIQAGKQQAQAIERQAEYNAQVYDQQAATITHKQKLLQHRDIREAAQVRGAITAQTAGKGLMLSGSPMAILADTESEMALDRAIGQYNLELDKHYAKSGAMHYREQGRMDARSARRQGYMSAFSTALQAGSSYAMSSANPLAPRQTVYRPTASKGGRTFKSRVPGSTRTYKY